MVIFLNYCFLRNIFNITFQKAIAWRGGSGFFGGGYGAGYAGLGYGGWGGYGLGSGAYGGYVYKR